MGNLRTKHLGRAGHEEGGGLGPKMGSGRGSRATDCDSTFPEELEEKEEEKEEQEETPIVPQFRPLLHLLTCLSQRGLHKTVRPCHVCNHQAEFHSLSISHIL